MFPVLQQRPRPVFMVGNWKGLLDEVGGSVSPWATHLDNLKKVGFPRHPPHAGGYSQEKSGPGVSGRTPVMGGKGAPVYDAKREGGVAVTGGREKCEM